MAMVHRSGDADADLDAIGEYIGRHSGSREIARNFLARLEQKLESHARQPLLGDIREDLCEGLRSFVFKKNYVVIYRLLEDGIDVLRVFHAARDYARLFREGSHQ